jgi:SAM-dependent MidA family methyltransferase
MSDARPATPLASRLADLIRQHGPLPVSAFMAACLDDPEHGYYRTKPAIGRAGDFVTAPEISQIFGELIGLWTAVVWQQMGAPQAVTLVELGPGRGTLMRDALRATRRVPGFHGALNVVMVDANPHLRAKQEATLQDAGVPIAWCASLDELAATAGGPAIVVANEFVDCWPVQQLVRADGRWHVRAVGLDAAGRLAFVPGPATDLPVSGDAPDGTIAETFDYASIGAALARFEHVAALIVDYGDAGFGVRIGDTLQAVRGHAYEPPLDNPGEADLTAHVAFGMLAAAVTSPGALVADGPITQATLLGRLGAVERASKLMAANPAEAAAIEGAVARLLQPAGMGGRFKALAIRSAGLPVPPGFQGATTWTRGQPA